MFFKKTEGNIVDFREINFEKNIAIYNLFSEKIDIANTKKLLFEKYFFTDYKFNDWVEINNEIHKTKTLIDSSFREPTNTEILNLAKLPIQTLNEMFNIDNIGSELRLYPKGEVIQFYASMGISESYSYRDGKTVSDDSVISYLLRGYHKLGGTSMNKIHEQALEYNATFEIGITKNEFIKFVEENSFAICCETIEETNKFMNFMYKNKVIWNNGSSIFEESYYDNFKNRSEIVYYLHVDDNKILKLVYGDRHKCSKKIIFYKDFVEELKIKKLVNKIKENEFTMSNLESTYDIKNSTFFQLARLEESEFCYLDGGGEDCYYDLLTVSAWDGYSLAIPIPILAKILKIKERDIYDSFLDAKKLKFRDNAEFI